MINILLAFDEEDDDIGSFNQGCKEDFEEFFVNKNNHNITYIGTSTLTEIEVQSKTAPLSSFIFAAYSHGDIDKLVSKNGAYVSKNEGIKTFKDSFFYTVSCLSANELGTELINNGCKSYFGYKTQFSSWQGYICFSACANYGFFKFIEGNSTHTVYDLMIENYNKHIDDMYKDDMFQAAILLENRNGLIRLGEDITIHDL